MSQVHKISFLITLVLLFLLPVFFTPGGALSLDVAKSALLVFGTVVATGVFLWEVWRGEKLDIPWHPFVLVVVLLPLVYLVSALSTTPSSLSLFGYSFEVGTFGHMLLGSVLLILVGTVFTNTSRTLRALAAFFLSFSLIAVFAAIKILSHAWAGGGDFFVWGTFFGNMGNPLGSWTDLAISFGLLSAFTVLIIGMVPMKWPARALVYGILILSTALSAIIHFSTALVLTLATSVLLLLYFSTVEKSFSTARSKPVFLSIALGVVSLTFLINPAIPGTEGTLGDAVARTFKIENTDVRPSFSATLGVSKAVLSSQIALLGSGPNTFGHDWLIYKPADVNATPFWAVTFPFGIGFIPTQIASTGILGTVLWLAFFVLLILLGVKIFSRMPESRVLRFGLVATFLLTFFLWISSFLYTPSGTLLILTFIFSGLLVTAGMETGVVQSRVMHLRGSPQARLVSTLLLVMVALGALLLGWTGFEKTISAFYWKNAIAFSNTADVSLQEVENELMKALKFAPADIHYVALSRVNFAKAQAAANATTGTPEENRTIFDNALGKSISAARDAVSANPAGFQNWVSLGMIYSALVPKPLAVEGAYENARFAYNEARKRNPANPELPLLLARLELGRGNVAAAHSFIRESVALKEDYADAYLMLAQLEIQEGNTALAIISAEKLALLVPNNPGIYFELGLLKYSDRNYTGAANAFKLALAAMPEYANAQYYLGLALARLGRLNEAQEQFEALSVTNPDNEEVQSILEDLRAGRSSFLNDAARN